MPDLTPILQIATAILLAGLVLCLVFLVRNILVSKVRIKAIHLVGIYTRRSIMENRWVDPKWRIFYVLLEDYPTYDAMMLDVRKWKFNQFYPQLEERAKRILEEGKRF